MCACVYERPWRAEWGWETSGTSKREGLNFHIVYKREGSPFVWSYVDWRNAKSADSTYRPTKRTLGPLSLSLSLFVQLFSSFSFSYSWLCDTVVSNLAPVGFSTLALSSFAAHIEATWCGGTKLALSSLCTHGKTFRLTDIPGSERVLPSFSNLLLEKRTKNLCRTSLHFPIESKKVYRYILMQEKGC